MMAWDGRGIVMTRCQICLGNIKDRQHRVNCPCGNSYHETCACKVSDCPSCGRALQNVVKVNGG